MIIYHINLSELNAHFAITHTIYKSALNDAQNAVLKFSAKIER